MKDEIEILENIVSPANNEKEWVVLRDLKLLLDTPSGFGALPEPNRLGKRVLQELNDPENEFWLSSISTCEALTSQGLRP
jgi:hypothetical protein